MVGQQMMDAETTTTLDSEVDVLGDTSEVINALQECVAICRANESAAVVAPTRPSDSRPLPCLECAQVCSLAISLLHQRSPLAIEAADLCSRACERCATAMSDRLKDEGCAQCVEVCQKAAQAIHAWRPLSTTASLNSVEAFGG